jgi:hypothetical protein
MNKQKINVKTTPNDKIDGKNKEIMKKEKEIKKDDDSSDISSYNENDDYENMTNDEISQRGKEKFFKSELMEKIIKYIKIDDSIKDKQKEVREQMKVLKTQKEEMEKYIITYLESINEEYVKLGETGKLTKTVSQTKGAIKPDNIKVSIFDELKKEKIADEKINELLTNIVDNIEKSRPVKTRTYIKRTKARTTQNIKKIAQKNIKNNDENENDDDIPKYNSNK